MHRFQGGGWGHSPHRALVCNVPTATISTMTPVPNRSRTTGTALEKWYQFVRWLLPAIEKFPRGHKFTLGERMAAAALDVLDGLIEATYSKQATPVLQQVNLGLEKVRFLLRLAFDLQLMDGRKHEFAARAVDEVGRLVGGWIKAKVGAVPSSAPMSGESHAQTAH